MEMRLTAILCRLWTVSLSIRSEIIMILVSGIFRIGCSLGFVWLSKRVIDIATNVVDGSVLWIAVAMVMCAVGDIVLSVLAMRAKNIAQVNGENILRGDLFDKLIRSAWNGVERYHSGDLLNRLIRDVKDVVTFLTDSFPALVVTVVRFVAAFLFLLSLNYVLALTLLAIMPVFLLLSKLYVGPMRKMTRRARSKDSLIHQTMHEGLQNRFVVKTLQGESQLSDRMSALQETLYWHVVGLTRYSIFSRALTSAGFFAGYIVAFLWGAVLLSEGLIGFGVVIAFLQLVGRIQRPIMEVASLTPSFVTSFTATERIMEMESLDQEPIGDRVSLGNRVGVIFEHIEFSYQANDHQDRVFVNFSYDFPPGTTTAIVGVTGVGKTTLVRLMLALVVPLSGDVYVYDENGDKLVVSSLTRCNFSYVSQGNSLFSGTIRDNLLLGNHLASEAQMERALYLAAAEFVFDLPQGLLTVCGENGDGLSHGQAQRIVLARALLSDGGVLLLDEATSALDLSTQELVLSRIASLENRPTVIFITHRLEVASICDRVLILRLILICFSLCIFMVV